MVRAAKAKRQSVAKLKRYAELMNEIALLSSAGESSSSSSKGKGKGKGKGVAKAESSTSSKGKGKGKGKSPKSPSSTAKERLMKQMEEIENWVMSKKNITAETENDMEMLEEISKKCGHYEGKIKIKCRDPHMKAIMKKTARNAGLDY